MGFQAETRLWKCVAGGTLFFVATLFCIGSQMGTSSHRRLTQAWFKGVKIYDCKDMSTQLTMNDYEERSYSILITATEKKKNGKTISIVIRMSDFTELQEKELFEDKRIDSSDETGATEIVGGITNFLARKFGGSHADKYNFDLT